MLKIVMLISMVIFAISMCLTLWRLFVGPDMVDRVLALDTLYINALALLVIFGIWLASDIFFEAALLIGLFGFVSTVALSKYLMRGDIIE
ncbi:K+/H+ antiporter subunit F [Pseudomonas sp. F1_0610]|uniref:K+/H+ antiporter subunit F n=1 Tax=Pseudomonas sp. F1_0610 TaxID=3114284 RepID=UPI0039C284DA